MRISNRPQQYTGALRLLFMLMCLTNLRAFKALNTAVIRESGLKFRSSHSTTRINAVSHSVFRPAGVAEFSCSVGSGSLLRWHRRPQSGTILRATNEQEGSDEFNLAAWFNPNTRGGVLVWSGLLTLIPVAVYNFFVSTGMDSSRVGAYVGALFVLLSNLLWASTYVFRVANKDMTYAKQLRDYENAVLQKRLEELADDEISALMEEIELEEKAGPASNRAAVGVVAGSVSTSDDQSRSIGSADTLSEGQVPVTVDSAVDSSPQSQTAGSV